GPSRNAQAHPRRPAPDRGGHGRQPVHAGDSQYDRSSDRGMEARGAGVVDRAPELPKVRAAARRPVRPPRLRSFPVIPRGPRLYKLDPEQATSGPGDPPPGFVTATTSAAVWFVYWAISKVLKSPKDPRQGPFNGWPGLWDFQHPMMGGRAARGGAVADFVIMPGNVVDGEILIRLQTSRWHLFTDSSKQATDQILRTRMARLGRVVDIYEQDVILDKSGQAALLEVKNALWGGKPSNPLSAGTAKRL